MTDRQLAEYYLPHFYVDEKEPFPIEYIGYRIFREPGKSATFPRDILLWDKAKLAIEYAVYFDFDIQHLYELEHAWVYLDKDGRVVDGEASAHGKALNCMRLGPGLEEGRHLPLFMQPGKHAMLPDGGMFPIFPDYLRACNQNAGNMGLLVTKLFQGLIDKPEGADAAVERYLRENYAFTPTFRYVRAPFQTERLIPTEELLALIPGRIARVLADIMKAQ